MALKSILMLERARGRLGWLGFPFSPTVPFSLLPNVKAKETLFLSFPEHQHLQTYSYPVLPVARVLPSPISAIILFIL